MSQQHILIVEDEYDILDTLQMIFSDEGYRVRTAPNGRAAIDRLKEERPDLVIIDNMMPFVSGVEVITWMRSQPALASVPVILVSAARPTATQGQVGWNRFMPKPFDIDRLLTATAELLAQTMPLKSNGNG